jgi:hypothetical protein
MPASVSDAIKEDSAEAEENAKYGVAFTGHTLTMKPEEFAIVKWYGEMVRFVNQAIEWENVITFLYSYFWDLPASWDFIRQIRHEDRTRQAFLRAGSARVVLTIRKGWEQRWVNFYETGSIDLPLGDSPYMSIAREIAAYDDRNYPGIPPANPARTAARVQEMVATTSSALVKSSSSSVVIDVESSKGFAIGDKVVIDSHEPPMRRQEAQTIVAIPDDSKITVDQLEHDHGQKGDFLIVRPGEKGILIAEWNEYTPSSGVDIAVTSSLTTIA